MKKEGNRHTLNWIREVAGVRQWGIAILTVIQLVLGLSGIGYALILRELINHAVAGEKEAFFWSAVAFAGLVIFQIILRAVTRFLVEHTKVGLSNAFKGRLFSALMKKEYEAVDGIHTAEWMTRMTSDAEVVADGTVSILPGLVGTSVKLVAALVMIMVFEPAFCYLILPGGVLLLAFTASFRKVLKKMHKDVQEREGKLRTSFQEYLTSMLIVRAYGVEKMAEQETGKQLKNYQKVVIRRNHFSNICNMGFGFMVHGAYVLGAVICGYGILKGTMSYGTFTAVLQLIGQVQAPFANITGFMPRFYNMLASAERMMEAEALEDVTEEARRSAEETGKTYTEALVSFGLAGAGFTYESTGEEERKTVVLKDIDLKIAKGEYVAFVGPSGCGKSTTLKLFLGLYPLDSGERYLQLLDGKEELDTSWQRLFAYVPQGNHLMQGTIREVIAFADKENMYDEARMQQALEISCAKAFVEELEQGLDTVLGERGAGLSEGQMQRLAIARAIFSDRPILLLDEATSALDEITEEKLLSNLRLMTQKTVLIVTHRPAVLDICDKIATFSEKGVQVSGKCDRMKKVSERKES